MVRQHLLIDVEEVLAVDLAQDGVANNLVFGKPLIEDVIGVGLSLDHASFFSGATASIDEQFPSGNIGTMFNYKGIRRVGLNRITVNGPEVQRIGVDDSEPGRVGDDRGEAHTKASTVGDIGRAIDLEPAIGAVGRIKRHDQLAVCADVQAGQGRNARLTRVQRALRDVDVQQAVAVGNGTSHVRTSGYREAVGPRPEVDIADNGTVLSVNVIRARSQLDLTKDRRLVAVCNAIIVGVREVLASAGDAALDKRDPGCVVADVNRHGLASNGIAVLIGQDIGSDHAGVGDRGQGAALVTNGGGIGHAAIG